MKRRRFKRAAAILTLLLFSLTVIVSAYTEAPFAPESEGASGAKGERPVQGIRRFWREIPPDVVVERDVTYGMGGDQELKLDILRPLFVPDEPMPVIVFFHGGAWMFGNKNAGVRKLIPFVEQGYVGVSVNYRLSDEATFPAQIEDCKTAIRFLRAHAEKYHIDPERIGVWGSSAGGHLGALLGTSGGVEELEGNGGWAGYSSRVQAVCDWFGPTDLTQITLSNANYLAAYSPQGLLLGGAISANLDKAEMANPINYITPDDPPFLIMHGARDFLVPVSQSRLLYDALQKAHLEVNFIVLKRETHGFIGDYTDVVMEFFDKHLKAEQIRQRIKGNI